MNETLKPTSVADYRKKYCQTKMVQLSSGSVFEIKKLNPMFYIENEGNVVSGIENITDAEERRKIITEKLKQKYDAMGDKEKQEFLKKQHELYKKIVVYATVNPVISLERENDKLHISDIEDSGDLYPLVKVISDFTGGADLSSFCPSTKPDNTG